MFRPTAIPSICIGVILAALHLSHTISFKQCLLYVGIYFAGIVVGYSDKCYLDWRKRTRSE